MEFELCALCTAFEAARVRGDWLRHRYNTRESSSSKQGTMNRLRCGWQWQKKQYPLVTISSWQCHAVTRPSSEAYLPLHLAPLNLAPMVVISIAKRNFEHHIGNNHGNYVSLTPFTIQFEILSLCWCNFCLSYFVSLLVFCFSCFVLCYELAKSLARKKLWPNYARPKWVDWSSHSHLEFLPTHNST